MIVVAASLAATSAFDAGDGWRAHDLELLGEPFDDPADPLDFQIAWAVDFVNGRTIDRSDISDRFAASFLAQISIDELVDVRESFVDDAPYRTFATLDHTDDFAAIVLIGRSGESYALALSVSTATGRIDGLGLTRQALNREPIRRVALTIAIASALALALGGNLVLRRRGSSDRTAPWLLMAALACVAQVGQTVHDSTLMTIGLVAGPLAVAAAAWIVIRIVTSGIVRRVLGVGVAGAVALAVLGTLAIPVPDEILVATPQLGSSVELARVLLDVRSYVAIVAASGVGAASIVELARRRSRRNVPIAAAGVIGSFVVIAVAAMWLTHHRKPDLTMSSWLDGGLLVVALGAGLSLFVERMELGGVARLVTDLGDASAPAALADSIGIALDDPNVELWYWSVSLDAYVTAEGERRDPDQLAADRHATRLSARGEPLAVVIHDASRGFADHRVAAVCAAARMALDNERLQAQVRAQLTETQASRARIVTAGDEARREVERNLHDGAQQRLLAVLVRLRRAASNHRRSADPATSETDGPLLAEVVQASDELAVALEELRAIARGLHPPALDRGLAAALDALAETAPIPVELHVADGLPSAGPVTDAAIYFFVAEALTNTCRHAAATHLSVAVHADGERVRATVSDDGRGGATLAHGTGLSRLADRAAALGGLLTLDSPPHCGTRLTLDLPSAPA